MTEITRFYGIIIRMYLEGGMYHHLAHFHASYQGLTVSIGIDPIEAIRGELPQRQQRLVEAWAELHQGELRENWQLLAKGAHPVRFSHYGKEKAMTVHEIYYIEEFSIIGPYTLKIRFDDQTVQSINFEPILRGELLGPLRDLNVFNGVRLDPEIRNLVWPNDAALDPETLHNWPMYQDKFIKLAQSWERVLA